MFKGTKKAIGGIGLAFLSRNLAEATHRSPRRFNKFWSRPSLGEMPLATAPASAPPRRHHPRRGDTAPAPAAAAAPGRDDTRCAAGATACVLRGLSRKRWDLPPRNSNLRYFEWVK